MTPRSLAGGLKVYPMTYEQEAMWLDDHLDDGPSRYLESWVYRLSGPLDLEAVEWAIARIVDRHEALRTRLTIDGDELVQVVLPEHGTRMLRRRCPAGQLDAELRRAVSQPLDLDVSPMRAILLQLASSESVLVVQFHHAVVDDWALAVFEHEFSQLYTARLQGRPAELAPLPLQLGEYALAQRSAGIDALLLRHWQQLLHEFPAQNSAPPDRPRPAAPTHRGGQIRFRIGDDAGELTRRLARAQRATPFTVFAAALTVLLCGYQGSDELILGTPISRRGEASLDGLIGCLTDLVPLRQAVRPEDSFAHLVSATRAVVWDAIAHKDLPYAELVARAVNRRDIRRTPLCQTALVIDDAPRDPLALPGVAGERLYVHPGTSKFDLCLTLVADGGGYRGFLEYASDLYDQDTAARIGNDFLAVLSTALGNPTLRLCEISQQPGSPDSAVPHDAWVKQEGQQL